MCIFCFVIFLKPNFQIRFYNKVLIALNLAPNIQQIAARHPKRSPHYLLYTRITTIWGRIFTMDSANHPSQIVSEHTYLHDMNALMYISLNNNHKWFACRRADRAASLLSVLLLMCSSYCELSNGMSQFNG